MFCPMSYRMISIIGKGKDANKEFWERQEIKEKKNTGRGKVKKKKKKLRNTEKLN